jgi:excisionase family DNA binding protein
MVSHPLNLTPATMDTLITVQDVAEILCVSTRQVYASVAAGRLPKPVKLGHRTTRWKATDIQAYLDQLKPAD